MTDHKARKGDLARPFAEGRYGRGPASSYRPGLKSSIAPILFLLSLFLFSNPASAGSFIAFGPQTYVRATGDPVTVTSNFTVLNPNTSYTLEVYNGGMKDGEYEKVSSSIFILNGVQVVAPSEFNQNTTVDRKPVTLKANNTLSVEVRGKVGGAVTVQVLGIDNGLPTITATVTPQSNTAGWYNTNPTVSFSCNDATSGILSCTSPITVTTEGAGQLITGTATDKASPANTATASVIINLDKTVPSITPSVAPSANAAGWHNTNPTVSFTCSDATSGIASCTQPVTVAAEGSGQIVAGTATDKSDNTAPPASVSINLDKTPPAISNLSPEPGSTLDSTSLTLEGTVTETLSGMSGGACNGAPALLTANGFRCALTLIEGSNTVVVSAKDIAGNSAASSPSYTVVMNPPEITIAGVTEGQVTAGDIAATYSAIRATSLSATLQQDNNPPQPYASGTTISATGMYVLTVTASNAAGTTTETRHFDIDKVGPQITVSSPASPGYVRLAKVTVQGIASDRNGAAEVKVNGTAAALSGNTFTAIVLLSQAGTSAFTVTAKDTLDNTSSSQFTVTLDTTPPALSDLRPASGSDLNSLSTQISGSVSDASGIASVTINGSPATVTGSTFSGNAGFAAQGSDTVVVTAVDLAGNTTSTTLQYRVITGIHPPVILPALPSATNQNPISISGTADPGIGIRITGGAAEQTATADPGGSWTLEYTLAANTKNTLQITAYNSSEESIPVTAEIVHDDIPPLKPVLLSAPAVVQTTNVAIIGFTDPDVNLTLTGPTAAPLTAISSPGNGMFGFQFQIPNGSQKTYGITAKDAAGNESEPTEGSVRHDPTLTQNLHLSVSEPQNWVGVAGQMFPPPLQVILVDANGDPVQGYSIRFEVLSGGGLVDGSSTATKSTLADGRTAVSYVLGPTPGQYNQIVRATFDGNIEPPVLFTITALEPHPGEPTTVEGTVLDENFRAIPIAKITLMRDGFPNRVTYTDNRGNFTLPSPNDSLNGAELLPGRYHLRADGTTTSLPQQRYPVLTYEIDAFEGQVNTIGMPIFLPRTQMENKLIVDGVTSQTYTTPSIPKLKVEIPAGTVTYPDGSHSGEFIISPVPIQVLPMPLPNGWATSLAISIQPMGTVFNPPLPITFPNVDGLPPGSKAAIVSFDHGAGRYVKVGDATVSADGGVVTNDPGSGIKFGAWHVVAPGVPCQRSHYKFGLDSQSGSSGEATACVSGSCWSGSFPAADPIVDLCWRPQPQIVEVTGEDKCEPSKILPIDVNVHPPTGPATINCSTDCVVFVHERAVYGAKSEASWTVTDELGVQPDDHPRETAQFYLFTAGDNDIGKNLTVETQCPNFASFDVLFTGKAIVPKIEIANPVDSNGDGKINDPAPIGNEFSFDTAAPGVLEIPFQIKVSPDVPEVRNSLDSSLVVRVDPIGASNLSWDNPNPADPTSGIATYQNGVWSVTASFTGLPANNSDFGPKTARITLETNGSIRSAQVVQYEVFYDGKATNHPGGTSTDPNWFYYYKHNEGGTDYVYDNNCPAYPGRSCSQAQIANSIKIANEAYDGDYFYTTAIASGRLKIVPPFQSAFNTYYANFVGVLAHERSHVANDVRVGSPVLDSDGDFLPDSFELNTSQTDPNDKLSAQSNLPVPDPNLLDDEVYAGGPVEEAAWRNADTSQDWANPGSNYGK